jgi:hypothetical protein
MPAAYQLTSGTGIVRAADGALIPVDPGNRDYQAFLAWEAAPNTPDPAAAAPGNPTTIPVAVFWARFTAAEQAAIMTAMAATPAVAVRMTLAAVSQNVNLLSGPIASTVIPALVTAGVLTAARAAVILTP